MDFGIAIITNQYCKNNICRYHKYMTSNNGSVCKGPFHHAAMVNTIQLIGNGNLRIRNIPEQCQVPATQ